MDLIVFSHLRWNFVYQRPQHIISRFVNYYRVFYIEEPVSTKDNDGYDIQFNNDKVWVVIPRLNEKNTEDIYNRQAAILDILFAEEKIEHYWFWYYSPMSMLFTEHFTPQLTVFDCMDELSAFKFAPPLMVEMEQRLMQKADVVFTGGKSLYDAKKHRHKNIYCFPSSIDKINFYKGRLVHEDANDQQHIPYPRLGFFGVIDEWFDIELVAELASKKPGWQIILVGPVVKIDEASLPRNKNIHYLGMKTYEELPVYIST